MSSTCACAGSGPFRVHASHQSQINFRQPHPPGPLAFVESLKDVDAFAE